MKCVAITKMFFIQQLHEMGQSDNYTNHGTNVFIPVVTIVPSCKISIYPLEIFPKTYSLHFVVQ